MPGRVAAIVVNFDGIEDTRGCVRSLLATGFEGLSICVVDNGSVRDEAAVLAAEFPQVSTLRLPSNLGYPGAANAGVEWARRHGAEYACLLNNDTEVAPDFFEALAGAAAGLGDGAILAPLILQEDGMVWSAGGVIRWPDVAGEHAGIGEDPARYREARPVTWASGCALFFSLAAFDRAGPFDESFFLYLEDIEWCLRARKRGLQVVLVPDARITHAVTKTIRRFDERVPRYYAYRNFYVVGFRHGSLRWRAVLAGHLLFTLAKIGARTSLSPRHRRDGVYHARTRGLLDFLRGRRGKAPYEHRVASEAALEA